MTKREQQKIETRNKIYEIAFQLFLEKGFDKVTVQMIVQKANLSVGAFYHHFQSKEAIIDERYRDFDELLEEKYQLEKPKMGLESIYYLIYKQNEACFEMGYELTCVLFKNQIGIRHSYMFNTDRFLVKALKENVDVINKGNIETNTIVEELLRITRGTIYDWCLHDGNYDLFEQAKICVNMCLLYYGLIERQN